MAIANHATGINYESFRRTVHTQIKPEGAAGVIDDCPVRVAQTVEPDQGIVAAVLVVQADDVDTFLLGQPHQVVVLVLAGRAPGTPDIQQRNLAPEQALVQHGIRVMQIPQAELRNRFADQGRFKLGRILADAREQHHADNKCDQ